MGEMLSNIGEKLANLAAEMLHDYTGFEVKMQTLKTEFQNLRNRETDVLAVLENEEIRTGRKRKREVKDWLEDVGRKKIKCDSLHQQVQRTKFYNIRSRLSLGKLIKEMKFEVEKLVESSKFPEGLLLEVCNTKGKPLVTTEWKGEHTLKQNFLTIWELLMNDVDSRIGIYGMGGVGKTTLAMRIHNKLLSDPKFRGHVYWIHLSQDSNIPKLQNDIAVALNLDLSTEDNENQRASQLFAALKRRKRFVLIFDDVWNPIDIEKIGIPLERDGSKLLITSRSVDVCYRMGCQTNMKIKVLGEEEAWELFLDKLGRGIGLPQETEKIAKEMAKRCAGLPLGIITMGGSMRGVTDIHEWRDALEELKESSMGPDDMETEVFPILFCSFNRLRDPKLQKCFLYCSLYPEDYRIPRDELISKFIAEELMDRRKSRQAYFDQGHAILNKLENASLLETTDDKSVKMHDLIRDMALRITRKNNKFMVKAGLQLSEMPEEQEWKEELDKISLMCNKISDISPCISPSCQKISTLILRRNPLKRIPDSFFLHMHGLQVLDLSYTWIESLPNSISDLVNLNALLLACCLDLKFVPPLTKLKSLKELDLNRNQIKELPQGMEKLVNLKCLNMGHMSCLETMPEGVLPKLSHLERLIISDHLQVRAEQLEGLKQLEEFQGLLHDVHDLNKFIIYQQKFGKLSFYNIVVGECDSWSRNHPESKRLTDKWVTFKAYRFKNGGEEKVLLPQDIQHLKFARCDGLKSCLSDLFASLKSLRTLKSFRISHCVEIEFILRVSSSDLTEGEQKSCIALQSLEKIILSWLPNLTSLVKLDLRAVAPLYGTFSVLKELRIEFCNKIKRLFTLTMLQCLHNLEDVYVSECAKMEELIGDDEEYNMDSDKSSYYSTSFSSSYKAQAVVTLPKLRALSLKWLPELQSICRVTLICDSVEKIGMFHCHKLRRLPFFLPHINGQVSPPRTLKQIRIGREDKEWWESLDWNHPNDKNILQPFVKCLNLGSHISLLDPGWKKLMFVFLFIRRLQVRSRS
ncbi:hypothetical protein ACJIZ3_001012 [Penstemon smallii]|uniref:AAA+ ATPase domain-containing protein n=1 Tax=Penstemon smallii TaxID=265156 RepID=A0ABD3U2C9_9LAMI